MLVLIAKITTMIRNGAISGLLRNNTTTTLAIRIKAIAKAMNISGLASVTTLRKLWFWICQIIKHHFTIHDKDKSMKFYLLTGLLIFMMLFGSLSEKVQAQDFRGFIPRFAAGAMVGSLGGVIGSFGLDALSQLRRFCRPDDCMLAGYWIGVPLFTAFGVSLINGVFGYPSGSFGSALLWAAAGEALPILVYLIFRSRLSSTMRDVTVWVAPVVFAALASNIAYSLSIPKQEESDQPISDMSFKFEVPILQVRF